MAEDQVGLHMNMVQVTGRPPYINDAVHVYNCIQQLGVCTEVWPLMENYLSIHAKEHFKVEERPNEIHQCWIKYFTSLGYKIEVIKGKDVRQEEQVNFVNKLHITPKAPLRTQIGLTLKSWDIGTDPKRLAALLGIDMSKNAGKLLVASDLVRIYHNRIKDEGKALCFNYAEFYRLCKLYLVLIWDQTGEELQSLGDSYPPGEDGIYQIATQVLDVLEKAVPRDLKTMVELLSDIHTSALFV